MKNLLNISILGKLLIYLLSTDEIWQFDGNFASDPNHIFNLQSLTICHGFLVGKSVFFGNQTFASSMMRVKIKWKSKAHISYSLFLTNVEPSPISIRMKGWKIFTDSKGTKDLGVGGWVIEIERKLFFQEILLVLIQCV